MAEIETQHVGSGPVGPKITTVKQLKIMLATVISFWIFLFLIYFLSGAYQTVPLNEQVPILTLVILPVLMILFVLVSYFRGKARKKDFRGF